MDSNTSRKRRRSESPEAASSRARIDALINHPSTPTTHQAAGSEEPDTVHLSGHRYGNTTACGSARAHYGDVYGGVTYNHYGTPHMQSADHQRTEDKRVEDFLEALKFERMDFRLATVAPAHGSTCRWVFGQSEYLKWRNQAMRASHKGLFWIKGKAGVGKSTIMKCIWKNARETMANCYVVAFFFNARGQPLEKCVEGMYRSLLSELLEKIPRLRKVISIPRSFAEGQALEVELLQSLFHEAVLGLGRDRLICIVDALDEGDQSGVRSMVRAFEDLAEAARAKDISFEACYASRHYPNITARFGETMVIEDQPEHAQDIRTYIWNMLQVGHGSLRDELRLELVKMSQGVFLWVMLVVRQLNETSDEGAGHDELFEVLRSVPDDLEKLLHNIVLEGARDERLVPAVTLLLVATRTLNIREFYHAIRLSLGQFSHWSTTDYSYNENQLGLMRRYVLSATRGLVEVPDESYYDDEGLYYDFCFDKIRPQFIHETVREYFLAGGLAGLRPDFQPNVLAGGHAVVVEWCLLWIQSVALACKTLPVDPSSGLTMTSSLDVQLDFDTFPWISLPLLRYVRFAMMDHMQTAYLGGAIDISCLRKFPLQEWIDINNIGSALMGDPDDPYFEHTASLLHFILESRCDALARAYIEWLGQSVPATTELDQSHRDETKGRQKEVSLGNSLNVVYGGDHFSPLGAAAYYGNSDTVQLLLDYGAEVSFPDEPGCSDGSALSQSIHMRHNSVVRLLLDHGASPNGQDRMYGHPLVTAIGSGNYEAMRMLLDQGADVYGNFAERTKIFRDILDFNRRRKGTHQLIQLLFERGARLTAQEATELLPSTAECEECPTLVDIFLQLGADPNARDPLAHGRPTTIHRVVDHAFGGFGSGQEPTAAIRRLLDAGADVNAVDDEGSTALIMASDRGGKLIVQVLLDHRANVNSRSNENVTAIEAAHTTKHSLVPGQADNDAWIGVYEDIIQMLLEAGAEDYENAAGCKISRRLCRRRRA